MSLRFPRPRLPSSQPVPTADAAVPAEPSEPGSVSRGLFSHRAPPASISGYAVFDHLAIMVAVVRGDGRCVFANSALEGALGQSRRKMLRGSLLDWFTEPSLLRAAVQGALRNEFSFSRLELQLRRPANLDPLPVHTTVNAIDNSFDVLVQMVEIEQESRQEREQRALGQAQANKELIRNLAHEIKNPLGGIRGAAQLLEMEVESRALTEYTQVIINEADRLQALVDRLLAPHRKPHVVSDVNIHEVCERVRALILAEFPRGLDVERDYDISIPDFCGDREQLIQAVLNIAHNAAQALVDRIARGDAVLRLHTRIRRQVTLSKQRFRLALELHIADNGPGVPDAIRDRIFYPLVSGREGGSGLGLTLAQTFVQQHQGTIECESEPGNCVFKIVIPFP